MVLFQEVGFEVAGHLVAVGAEVAAVAVAVFTTYQIGVGVLQYASEILSVLPELFNLFRFRVIVQFAARLFIGGYCGGHDCFVRFRASLTYEQKTQSFPIPPLSRIFCADQSSALRI